MSDDRDFIGRVKFSRDVVITSNPSPIAGYTRRAVTGELVTVTSDQTQGLDEGEEPQYLGYKIAVDFECEPISTIDTLRAYWRSGNPVPFRCDEETGTCILDPENGLQNLKHESGRDVQVRNVRGQYLDQWYGRVNLFVITGYADAGEGGLPPGATDEDSGEGSGLATGYLSTGYNLQIRVKRNGETVLCSAGAVTRAANDTAVRWEVTTIAPIPDLSIENDVWDMEFGLAGKAWYVFHDRKADGARGMDSGDDGGVTVSGTMQTLDADLLNYGTAQTMVFCSPVWLDDVFRSWQLNSDGSLTTRDYMQYKGDRLYHERLPGKEYAVGNFQCIVGPTTHHEVAKYIANMLGFDIHISTPDMELLDTFTIQSGMNWFEAIKTNFTIWGPTIRVEAAVGGGRPTIQIVDVLNAEGGTTGLEPVMLKNAIIQSVTYATAQKGTNREPVDHVIVTGRNKTNSFRAEAEPDLTPIRIPELNLGVNFQISNEIPLDQAWEPIKQLLGDAPESETFGMDTDAYETTTIAKEQVSLGYYRYRDPKTQEYQYLLLEERHEMIGQSGGIEGIVERTHKYGTGYVPISTIETEWGKSRLPGESAEQLLPLRWKCTSQQYVVRDISQAITAEAVREMIVYDEIIKDNQQHKDNPNSLQSMRRQDKTRTAIDKTKNTTQRTKTMFTKFRSSFINRTADKVLLKQDFEYDVMTGMCKAASQTLRNPKDNDVNLQGSTPQRWEFYRDGAGKEINGKTCYKRTVSVSHDDICTEEIARAIADRIFYRKTEDTKELSIKTTVPVPFGSLPAVVDLVSIPKVVTVAGTTPQLTTAVSVPGGRYFVKAVNERFSVSKDVKRPVLTVEQTLTLGTKL